MAHSFAQKRSTRDREARALELRSQGYTYEEIARAVGFSNRGAAYKAVQRGLLATIKRPADDLRLLELERLEEMFRNVWPKAVDAGHPQQLPAIDRLLSIMERMESLTGVTAATATGGARADSPRSTTLPPREPVLVLDIH